MTTLLVASTGGHLKQLHRLHRRLAGINGPFRWATFDTPQSRSLLEGEAVDFVHFVGGRDPGNVLRNVPLADRILRRHEIETLVSTGSAVALPFFALGRARGVRCHYIESAARSDGPSKTASMISRIPGVHLYTQYPAWADHKWQYRGAVFDSFVPAERLSERPSGLRKVVVSLGMFKDIGFERLVRRLLEILPRDADVLWQTGDTDVSGLGIVGHRAIPERELTQAIREADVLVAHAGVGTALAALRGWQVPGPRAPALRAWRARRRPPDADRGRARQAQAGHLVSTPTSSRSTTSSPLRLRAWRRYPPTRRSRHRARGSRVGERAGPPTGAALSPHFV